MALQVDNEMIQRLPGSHFAENACSADTITLYNIRDCLWAGRSQYAEIVIAESPEFGRVLFLDKELQSSELDEAIYHEHLVHPIMNATCHIPQKNVLVVGGGEGATVREVLKWDNSSVASVCWVDIDNGLVNLCRRYLGWADENVYNSHRLRYINADINDWLPQQNAQFDVIILDLPDPDVERLEQHINAGAGTGSNNNMLYSLEFFRMISRSLNRNGAMVTHTGPVVPRRRGGLNYVMDTCRRAGFQPGSPYHVNMPSFQSEWGFWMSVQPVRSLHWPNDLQIMDYITQEHAMTWPRYWFHYQ